MLNFEYYLPTRFVFGEGAEDKAGEMVKALHGTTVLIHYGSRSAETSGLIARVEKSIVDAGLTAVKLGGALPNPRDDLVYQGIELCRARGVDFVVGVGGGSAIDSAKAIANGVPYEGDFWDFYSGKATPKVALPVGCVLTIAAAGSESSNSSVIMQAETKVKRGLNCEIQRPQFALMNPSLTMTLPPYQTACGVADMMAHILERYFTNTPDVEVTDRIAEGLLLTIIGAAKVAMREPSNYAARADLMWAGTLAHNNACGVGRVGDWASHQIEHELSGLYDVAHGAGLAVVLPAWMRYTLHHDPARFAKLATRVFGVEPGADDRATGLKGIEAFEAFLTEIGMPVTFKELGAKGEDIPYLAAHTKRNNAGTHCGFYVPLDTEAIEAVLRIADR